MTKNVEVGKVIRDDNGRITKLEGFSEEATLIPFIDDVARCIERFDESTHEYSKRMEMLTVAMLILAVSQILLAIVNISS